MEHFNNQKILPAANNIKEFEKLMETDFEYVILLNSHIAQLTALMKLARRHQKKVLLHVDLVQGLRSDEYGAEYLCQKVKPAGLISTRTPVIQMAKKIVDCDSTHFSVGFACFKHQLPADSIVPAGLH